MKISLIHNVLRRTRQHKVEHVSSVIENVEFIRLFFSKDDRCVNLGLTHKLICPLIFIGYSVVLLILLN